jgi:hypothetical protein
VESVTPLELVQEALEPIEKNALKRSAINWSEQKPHTMLKRSLGVFKLTRSL